jgi:carboxyl-terminal processing protease
VTGAGAAGGRNRNKSGLAAAIVTLGVALTAVVSAAGIVAFRPRQAPPEAPPPTISNAAVFDRVWLAVSQNYFDTTFGGVDWKATREHYRPIALAARHPAQLYNEAIWPMLDQVGASHLEAVAPDIGQGDAGYGIHLIGRRGEALSDMAGGVGDLGGLTVVHDGKQWTVYDVRKDSEPERLGIEPGRIVLSSRTESIKGSLPSRFKVELMLSKSGGGNETIAYEFSPRPKRPLRVWKMLPSGLDVIRFDTFDKINIDWVLARLKDAGPEGVILDLRANRGGNLGQLARLGGAFLPDRAPIGRTVGRVLTLPLVAPTDRDYYPGPVAVLIGPQTASAGEILAHVLRQNRHATLVGDRTAGAVLTSRYWRLPDGGRLTVATGNFTTPDGQRLEGVGVLPDIPAAETLAAIREDRDLVVEIADQALLGQPKPSDLEASSSINAVNAVIAAP